MASRVAQRALFVKHCARGAAFGSCVARRALLVSCVALCGGGTGLPRPAAGLAASGEGLDRGSVDRTSVRSETRADRREPRPTRDDDGGRLSMERAMQHAMQRLQTAPPTEPSGDSRDPAMPAPGDAVAAAAPGVARAGGPATVRADGPDAFSYPAPGLSREDRRAFSVGNSFFRDNWVAAPASAEGRDGLGPHFAANSCSACHQDDGRGRPPLPEVGVGRGSVVFVSPWDDDGAPHPVYGAQLQDQAVEGVQREAAVGVSRSTRRVTLADGAVVELERFEPRIDAPAYGPLGRVRLSLRIGPQVVGMGLLEAVPDAALLERADPDDRDGDGISGRAHMISGGVAAGVVSPRVGRFGWKASQPTLEGQVAAALAGDMGLTSAAHPDENHTPSQLDAVRAPRGGAPEVDEHKVARLAHYCRVLAVPAQRVPDDAEGRARIERGRAVFDRISCAACHAPTLRTGAASPVELLREVEFHPYTDLLLHDMGDGLADDRRDGDASGREWRTPPLWGLGLLERVHGETRLLHDGRARSVEEAVLWHGGEAARSRDAFAALSAEDRAALVAFVLSL